MTKTYRSLTLEEAEVLWQLGCDQFEWEYVIGGVAWMEWLFNASPAQEDTYSKHKPEWKKKFRIEIQEE